MNYTLIGFPSFYLIQNNVNHVINIKLNFPPDVLGDFVTFGKMVSELGVWGLLEWYVLP